MQTTVLRHRYGDALIRKLFLQYAVTASLPNNKEPLLLQNPADVLPESTRSLLRRNLYLRHEYFMTKSPGNFFFIGGFKEERQRFY